MHAHTTLATSSQPSQASADTLLSFAGVGVLSTCSYLLLFAAAWSSARAVVGQRRSPGLLHAGQHPPPPLAGPSLPADAAGLAGRPSFVTVVAALYGVSLVATTVAIATANALVGPSLLGDALAATIASCGAALLRFSLLRGWAFRPSVASATAQVPGARLLPS